MFCAFFAEPLVPQYNDESDSYMTDLHETIIPLSRYCTTTVSHLYGAVDQVLVQSRNYLQVLLALQCFRDTNLPRYPVTAPYMIEA